MWSGPVALSLRDDAGKLSLGVGGPGGGGAVCPADGDRAGLGLARALGTGGRRGVDGQGLGVGGLDGSGPESDQGLPGAVWWKPLH